MPLPPSSAGGSSAYGSGATTATASAVDPNHQNAARVRQVGSAGRVPVSVTTDLQLPGPVRWPPTLTDRTGAGQGRTAPGGDAVGPAAASPQRAGTPVARAPGPPGAGREGR